MSVFAFGELALARRGELKGKVGRSAPHPRFTPSSHTCFKLSSVALGGGELERQTALVPRPGGSCMLVSLSEFDMRSRVLRAG